LLPHFPKIKWRSAGPYPGCNREDSKVHANRSSKAKAKELLTYFLTWIAGDESVFLHNTYM
jgi:hypothetical protein